MTLFSRWLRRASVAAAIALSAAGLFLAADALKAPAQAQGSVSIEFRLALEPYGAWRAHPRWGEVWVPARRARDWRPYVNGRWLYTEDWGWYWVSDRTEDEWGWVTFHYGRWVFDRDFGWIWLSGEEWGPAWVDWRRGDDIVGWAPLPPEEIIVEMRDEPDIWLFVRAPDLIAPRVRNVILPPRERIVFIQRSIVENRTIVIEKSGARIAVNPGIPPAYIAAIARRPLPAYQVRPRVLAGTRGVEGGIEIRIADISGPNARRDRARFRETLQPTAVAIQPASSVPPPQPLRPDEKGRLGDRPPRAAQGATQPAAPSGPPPSIPSPGAAPEQSRPSAAPAEQPQSSAPTMPEQRRETAPAGPAPTPPPAPAAPPTPPPAAPTPPAPTATPQPATPEQRREQRRPAAEQPPGRQPGAAAPAPAQPPAARPPRPTPPIGQQPAAPPVGQQRATPPAAREAPPASRPAPAPAARPAPAPAPAARPAPPPAQAAPPAPASAPRPPAPAARPAPAPKPEEKKDEKKEGPTPRF